MLRLSQLLAASHQPQLQTHTFYQPVLQLQQAIAAALPQLQQQQQQQQQQYPLSSPQQQRHASTDAAAVAESSSSNKAPIRYPTKHEQRVAHLKFCQARAAWRRQVKALRMQWLAELRAQRAAQRAAAEGVAREIEALKATRSADRQQDREKHQLERLLWEGERAVDNAERRLASARREAMRQETLRHYRQLWRQDLETSSRTWIAPEDLEARVAAALDNPQHL